MPLSDRLIRTFELAADALIAPSGEGGPGQEVLPSELDAGRRLVTEVYDRLDPRGKGDLESLLKLLDSGPGGLILHGTPISFTAMKPEERVRALERMSKHPFNRARFAFRSIKSMAGMLWSNPPHGHTGPWEPWEGMGYPGPNGPAPQVEKPIAPLQVSGETALDCDVVVVGSGSGGGVAAGVLAAAGLDVVVLEKGAYHNEADFAHHEPHALSQMYLDAGLGTTSDGAIAMLAGSTLGGGTVVNYTTSFPPPGRVREEWDRISGFDQVFTGREFELSVEAVIRRLDTRPHEGAVSERDAILERGLRALGWHVDAQPRNVAGCDPAECGYCGMGCRIGAKQSTLRTWLEDAHRRGARIVVGADVDRVVVRRGRATGVEATVDDAPLTVRGRAVVLAAGALNTPAVLLRSGVTRRAVGSNLRLHPVTAVWGRFDDAVKPWGGIIQARYSDEFADAGGDGYGFRFETAAVHPTFPGALFGWDDGAIFRSDLLGLAHWTPVGILLRDRSAGRVKVRSSGHPVWDYRLGSDDIEMMRQGVARGAELLAAAGAEEVLASTIRPVRWRPGDGGSVEDFVSEVDSVGFGPNQTAYLSFHQMGSARMGSSKRNSVAGPENEVHGVDDLYVLDASAFPASSGVNPMITIMAIAHRGARALAARLG